MEISLENLYLDLGAQRVKDNLKVENNDLSFNNKLLTSNLLLKNKSFFSTFKLSLRCRKKQPTTLVSLLGVLSFFLLTLLSGVFMSFILSDSLFTFFSLSPVWPFTNSMWIMKQLSD